MKKQSTVFSRELFVKSGRKGGKTTRKRGKKYYQDIGRAGAKIRWDKNRKSLVSISSE